MDTPKFPDVTVQLSGLDGNSFSILGRVHRKLKHAGASAAELAKFHEEATLNDYDHLLRTCAKWVHVS